MIQMEQSIGYAGLPTSSSLLKDCQFLNKLSVCTPLTAIGFAGDIVELHAKAKDHTLILAYQTSVEGIGVDQVILFC